MGRFASLCFKSPLPQQQQQQQQQQQPALRTAGQKEERNEPRS
jgi:hypothetical protein